MTAALDCWAQRWGISAEIMAELSQALMPELRPAEHGQSETTTQADLRLVAPYYNSHLWRNNSGVAVNEEGRHIRYGLANDSKRINKYFKSSDLIGIAPVKITQNHVGKTMGIFTAIEVKGPKFTKPSSQREHAQAEFLSVVQTAGGIGIFANDRSQFIMAIEGIRHG